VTSQTLAYGTPDAFTTSYSYDSDGRLLNVTAPGNETTHYGYDALGRVAAVVAAWGTPIAATTTTNYDNLGEVTSVTAPGGAVSRYGYDVLGRSVSATAAYGTSLARTTTTAYDTLGRTIAVTDPANKTTTTAYDDIARTVAVTDPLNETWTTAYDAAGRPTTNTDPLGKSTITAYDLLGRVTSVTDQLSHATTYKYNVNGDRDTVTDPNTNLTETAYDQFGRTIQVVDPLGHNTDYAYDRAGRVTVISDALGRQRQFGYDGLGRKTSESWYTLTPDGLVFVQTQTFGYDDAGNLSSATDPDGNYAITSDALNRPVTVNEPLGLTLTFGYDAASNRNSVTDNRGGVQTSTFNLLNQLTSRTLHTSTADARVDYTYTPRGQLDTASRFTDLAGTTSAGTSVYGHDDAGHVTGITHHIGSGAVLADYSYTYDDAGRLHTKTENGTTTTFGYDDASQLTQDGAAAHSYDATGNRTDTGYSTTNGNRLQSDGTWTYTYDDAGELIKKSKGTSAETWTYQYDHRGQLVVAEQRDTDGGTLLARVEYAYDAFGNRLRRTEWNGTGPGTIVSDERFAYDGWDTAKPPAVGSENFDAWADLDASGNVTTRRLFGAGVDNLVARLSSAGAVAWYGTDLQGSVRLVFDNSGVYGLRDYTGFGAIAAQSGAGLDRYGYTGREWDSTLGVQYSRARIYDPATGRFLTADPMGFAAGDVNLYRYVGNGPTGAVDPSGFEPPTLTGFYGRQQEQQWERQGLNWVGRPQSPYRVITPDGYIYQAQDLSDAQYMFHRAQFQGRSLAQDQIATLLGYGIEYSGLGPTVRTAHRAIELPAYLDPSYQGRPDSDPLLRGYMVGHDVSWGEAVSGMTGDATVAFMLGDGLLPRRPICKGLRKPTRPLGRDPFAVGGGADPLAGDWSPAPSLRLPDFAAPDAGAAENAGAAAPNSVIDPIAEINRNADLATEMARRAAERGRLNGTPQDFGNYAHERFRQLNQRLDRLLEDEGSPFRVSAEEFRFGSGDLARYPRESGSIGADAVLRRLDDPDFINIFDLKTHGGTLRPISEVRQTEFLNRFGARALELYRIR
jgi:RHS repeat-associated protein